MDAELAAYDRTIDRRFGLMVECIRGLTAGGHPSWLLSKRLADMNERLLRRSL